MPHLIVEASAVQAVLKSLKPLAKPGRAGDGSFTLSSEMLQLRWAGGEFEFDATGDMHDRQVTVLLAEAMMLKLAGVLPKKGEIRVSVAGDRLILGTMSLPCAVVAEAAPHLLSVNANALEVALLPYRHDRDVIERSGAGRLVEEVERKRTRAIAAAANTLAWLEIDEDLLGTWVEAHLTAKGRGEKTFRVGLIVANAVGQVELFPK